VSLQPILIPAHNPSPMTGPGNNTYLIAGFQGEAVLIDAGVGNQRHLDELGAQLKAAGARLARVLVTHGHADHASGTPAIHAMHPQAIFAKHPWPGEDARYGVPWRTLADGDTFAIDDMVLTALHTPGHSPDHLVFWDGSSGAIFAGDLVIPGGSVMIHTSRGGDLGQYVTSLERLLSLEPRVLWPAHGPRVDDPRGVITAHLEHRRLRERQVIDAVRAGRATVPAIAECIYHGLNPALLPAAHENVRAHLAKLKSDGAVAEEGDRWTLS
jgi:glyoxylase-like metal-dependent hydrolase (beta-lactamase superfamily II)